METKQSEVGATQIWRDVETQGREQGRHAPTEPLVLNTKVAGGAVFLARRMAPIRIFIGR